MEKDEKTNSYVNESGEHIKINNAFSLYDKSPAEKDHAGLHIKYDQEKETFEYKGHDGDGKTTGSGSGNCFLTSACMKHFQKTFDDSCHELNILRWFRDNFVSTEEIEHYYQTAPIIVSAIDRFLDKDVVYNYIYENVVQACVVAIQNGDYDFAYDRYKNSILSLEETFVRKELQGRFAKSLSQLSNSLLY